MTRKLIYVTVAIALAIGLASCGGGSNAKACCEAMIGKLLTACDSDKPEDVATVIAAFPDIGMTADELTGITEAEGVDQCVAGLEEGDVVITDEGKDAFVLAVNGVTATDCAEVAGALAFIFGQTGL